MATHVYLARWVWNTTETMWEAPLKAQCLGTLDLRSRSQMGTSGGTGGFGMFAYATTVSIAGSTYLGADFASINNTRRNAINSNLGTNLTVNEGLDRVITKLLTLEASADGSAKWRPLKILKDRRLDIRLAGIQLAGQTVADDGPEFLATLAARKIDYARARASGMPLSQLRKWNGYDLIHYYGSLDGQFLGNLVAPEHIADGFEAPATTISDNFNRANESLDVGSWVEVVADWSIDANVCKIAANAFAFARHTTALSSDNHRGKVTVTTYGVSGGIGAAVRMSTDASPNHDAYAARMNTGSTLDSMKVVNGTLTIINSSSSPATSAPDDVEIQANGSNIKVFLNSVEIYSDTDTSITGNLYAGMFLRRTGDRVDDFTAYDLTVASSYNYLTLLGAGS